ncbi:uncharacterized protein ARMOST_20426 [Armillaria ostoyae]|uniref:Heterokaryon incompatibility domain-containing protein n=1 Tax=Armillaria ostoyae TaxID=47428 RepID=A0A284S7F4_ARMOS|nr:uncharacterized protein ARMOST_20426 [Armillaria ostoyae]
MGLGNAFIKHWKRWLGKSKDNFSTYSMEEQAIHLPEVILPTVAENGRRDSRISVLKQQSSAGSTLPVISSSLADLPFSDLDMQAVSEEFKGIATPGLSHNLKGEQEHCLPKVTLSAIAENGQQDSSIPALKRQSSTGGRFIIPSGPADVPCAELGIDAVFEELDDSATLNASYNLEEEQEKCLPVGTLSAFIETGRPESSIPVLKQRSYTGSERVIPSALANISCANLGVDAVVEKLNVILGTSHKLMASVSAVLESYITRNYDFGMVYGYLRRYWVYFSDLDWARDAEEEARKKEQELLVNGRIKALHTSCRRVWDLYANQVVPYWATCYNPWGISHAWMDERDRVDVWTPINRCEWPVPMPKDANLDLIQIEMLNLGAEYVWMDVLCLRQEGGPREDLRMQEWKIDMPTIGWVYVGSAPVVCYFCGLGRPLRLKPGYFEDDRCWFKRAWTLQEISEETIIGGETGDDGTLAEDIQLRFHEQLASL